MSESTARSKARKKRETWGSIRLLPSKRHQASYIGPDGERHNAPVTFDTVKVARAWLNAQHVAIQTNTWKSPEQERAERERAITTFGAFAERFVATRRVKGKLLRDNTRESYQRMLHGPLAQFSDRTLTSITRSEVMDWHEDILASGRMTTASVAYILFRSIMSDAVDRGLIEANPVRIREAASLKTGKDIEPPTREQLAIMVEAMDVRYRALLLVCAWGGLRFGEATELRRKDVKVTKDESGAVVAVALVVHRAVTHTTVGGTHVGDPKSSTGKRTVYLPPQAYTVLLEHIKERTGRFGDSLVFVAPTRDERGHEKHLKQSSLWKVWSKAREAADRSDMPWHALRHFAGTRHQEAGATLKDTMAFLGHATPGVAMGYQHETGRGAELAARMA